VKEVSAAELSNRLWWPSHELPDVLRARVLIAQAVGAKTAFIEPGSPWENGYCESVNAKLRDQLLNGEIFYSLAEARVAIEGWRKHYNTIRPHSTLGYKPPAPEVVLWPASPADAGPPATPAVALGPTMH
jgi:putative transposase